MPNINAFQVVILEKIDAIFTYARLEHGQQTCIYMSYGKYSRILRSGSFLNISLYTPITI